MLLDSRVDCVQCYAHTPCSNWYVQLTVTIGYNMRALHLLHVVSRFQHDGVHVGVHVFVCVLYLPHHHYVPCVLCFHFHVM